MESEILKIWFGIRGEGRFQLSPFPLKLMFKVALEFEILKIWFRARGEPFPFPFNLMFKVAVGFEILKIQLGIRGDGGQLFPFPLKS